MLPPDPSLEALVDTDLDTLATALYVVTDDLLTSHSDRLPPRPQVGIALQISDTAARMLRVLKDS